MPLSAKGKKLLATRGVSLETVEKALSPDALLVGASLFGMMTPGQGEMRFHMIEFRPTRRTQVALDELVSAGLISSESINRYGGLVYKPLWNFRELGAKLFANFLSFDASKEAFPIIELVPVAPSRRRKP